MVSLIQQPSDISFTRNPIIYQFRASDDEGDLFISKGVRAELRTNGYWGIANDETISIEWTDADGLIYSVEFTAKDIPNSTIETEIPTDINAFSSPIDYYQFVADKISAHHLIAPFLKAYTLLYPNLEVGLFIEVLEIADSWSTSFETSDITSPNFTINDYTEIDTNELPDNYEIVLELFFEKNYLQGDFEKIASLANIPGTDSLTAFNLQAILDESIVLNLPDPPIPSFENKEPFLAQNIRRYYIRYSEDFHGISSIEWTNSEIKIALCGGISQSLYAQVNFFETLSESNSLLTWYPNRKTVSTDQPEYLAWFNYTNEIKEVFPRVKIYDDASALPQDTLFSFDSIIVNPNEIALIPVGYDQLNLGQEPQDIQKYEVNILDLNEYISQNEVELSQSRIFYVDKNYHGEKRYIMYLNSFCLPETLRCIGYFTNELQIEREESNRILEPSFTSTTHEIFQYNYEFNNFFTYRSGYLSKHEVEALQQLLIYNRLYEVSQESLIPLLIKDKKYRITETRQFLHSIQFQAVPALKAVNYSGLIEQVSKGWQITSGGRWQTSFSSTWKTS